MATIAELIQTAQDNLAVVLAANPAAYVDYKIGNKSVSKSQYVRMLARLITDLSGQVEGDFDFATIGLDVSEIGIDLAEYDT